MSEQDQADSRLEFARLKQEHSDLSAAIEKIKAEVLAEYEGDEQEVFDSIDRFIDDMRVRRVENEQILAEASDDEGGAD